MQIENIKDVKTLKSMIHATRSHLARIEMGSDTRQQSDIDEMELDLVRLKLRLEELSPQEGEG